MREQVNNVTEEGGGDQKRKRTGAGRPDRLRLRIGSLCTGYGGLDAAAARVFGGRLVWCADNDPHVSTILAARFPGVPNLGDIGALNWARVPQVDIVCAGFPCQDLSWAGRGAGIAHCAGDA